MKSLKDILGSFDNYAPHNKSYHSKSKGMKEFFDFLSLVQKWEDIVGDKLASKTIPQGIYKQRLVIVTNHSAFAQQLSFMENILLKKVIETFPSLNGKLKGMIFKYDSQKFEQQQKVLKDSVKKTELKDIIHPLSPEYKILKDKAEALLSDVQDLELKEQLISIYIQSSVLK